MAALDVLRNYEEDVCLRLMLESSLVHMLSEACKVVLLREDFRQLVENLSVTSVQV